MTDATDPIREKAVAYPDVDEGMACTQSSFKTGKKSFLFIGEQGGRYKAMFKLGASKDEAFKLAKQQPDNFQAGSNVWVTARFTDEEPMPSEIWERWLDESYALTVKPKKKPAKK